MRIIFLFILMFGYIAVYAQLYQGPANGSINAGVIVNTNNFTEDISPKQGFRPKPIKNYFNIMKIPDVNDKSQPMLKSNSNYMIDPSIKEVSNNTESEFTLTKSFEGVPDEGIYIPPDPYLAVGPNHIMAIVNCRFRIMDKNGNVQKTIVANTWYNSLMAESDPFDPKVIYDHYSDRWIMVWLSVQTSTSYFMISVSDDSDPNGEWFNWKLPSNVNGNIDAGNWADYQGVGYDENALYITSNQFSFAGSYDYVKIRILNKSELYASTPGSINWKDIWDIKNPSQSISIFGLRPTRDDNATNDYYLVNTSPYVTGNYFIIYKLTNALTNPVLTSTQVNVTPYTNPNDAGQLGSSNTIDGGSDNLRNEPVVKNGVLHLVHSVKSGTNGEFSAVRYCSINLANYSVSNDIAMGADNYFYFYPALAVDNNNNVAITYTRSGTNSYAGAYYCTKSADANTLMGSKLIKEGVGSYYKTFGGERNRWGDYNGAWADPSNSNKIFVLTEYVANTNTWGTWIGELTFESGTGTLTLNFPTGGETLISNNSYNITWTSNNISNINIDYSTDNGNNWVNVVSNISAATGVYNWLVPNTPSANCKVKISDANNSQVYSICNSVFTISNIAPNKFVESFEESFPPLGWVKYNPDGGTGWNQQVVGTTPIQGWNGGTVTPTPDGQGGSKMAFCTWNTGGTTSNDQWLVSPKISNITNQSKLKFWVRKYSAYNDVLKVKISTTNNQISSFTDLATYTYTSTADTGWMQKEISLSSYAGQNIYLAFQEIVADNQTDGGAIFIDLFEVDFGNSINIINPNGGETLQAGNDYNILWSSNSNNYIRIEYTTNNGSNWELVVNNINAGSNVFVWKVPNVSSQNCKIRITDENSYVIDESDSLFSISNDYYFDFVKVNKGSFMMGSNTGDASERPIHKVKLNSFNIGKFEVTQKLWAKVMNNNPSQWQGENLPVEKVSWNQAKIFINKLNQLTGRNYRLPTEAEWEYASREGVNNSNTTYSGNDNIEFVAWYKTNAGNKTHIVGTKSPNSLGIYDMSGNVWELVNDWYSDTYYNISPEINPNGPDNGTFKVRRGGSWNAQNYECRTTTRATWGPDMTYNDIGLRLAEDVKDIMLIEPNETILLQVGRDYEIKWSSRLLNNLNIEYSTNNGQNWMPIVNNYPADSNSYCWLVPDMQSDSCKIRIYKTDDLEILDVTSFCFSIMKTNWVNELNFSNSNESRKLKFGKNDLATNGIDLILGEEELPPAPPSEIFDVRFILPTTPEVASLIDFRKETEVDITWVIALQPGSEGYPITLTWDKTNLPEGTFTLKDAITGSIVNVNMKNQNSYTLTNSGINQFQIVYSKDVCTEIHLSQGWNIVSVPIKTEDMSKTTLFQNASSSLFSYNAGYQIKDSAVTGKGYWIKYTDSEIVNLCGEVNSTSTVPVKTGWNLIGAYDKNIAKVNLTSTPTGIITSNYFGYQIGYILSDTLKVGKGYWVKANADGVINLNTTLAKSSSEETLNPKNKDWGKITISDNAQNNSTLYLSTAGTNLDYYELPPIPPTGIFDVRYNSDRITEDISTEQEIVLNSTEYPVTIRVEGADLKITDITGSLLNKTVKDGESLVLTNSNINRLKIQGTITVLDYELSQNYPNPFNPTTKIKYTIPEIGHVKLIIYNQLGQKVTELVNEIQSAGRYEVNFNAEKLSSGVYFYRIEAGKFSNVKKMMILK